VIATPETLSLETPEASQKPDASPHSKPCSICHRLRNILIRCQYDETRKWHFVCTGKCWQGISGGRAYESSAYPLYRYGGMWKNKHEYVSAKIKGKAKEDNKDVWHGTQGPHRRPAKKALGKHKSKKDLPGQIVVGMIGSDDGASDIEVSELSDEEEEDVIRASLKEGGMSHAHIQVKYPDEV